MICNNAVRLVRALLLAPNLVAIGLLAAGQARAATPGDRVAGGQLAATWCSACHQINMPSRDDADHGFPTPGAPSFAAIAAMPSTTALSIDVFLRTTHNGMPNYKLTPAQIDDAAAYIISLRHPQIE